MSGAAPLWDSEGDVPFVTASEDWRGAGVHPESEEPGWPEPPPESEYGLYRKQMEEDDDA